MNGPGVDPGTHLGGGVSIPAGTALSGTTAAAGDWVDCKDLQGPVYAEFNCGNSTGSPSAFTATCKLREADTSGGSGAQDIPVQDDALVLSANKTGGFVTGRRTKRYVQAHATPAFTGGSSPTLPIAAQVRGQKIFS